MAKRAEMGSCSRGSLQPEGLGGIPARESLGNEGLEGKSRAGIPEDGGAGGRSKGPERGP